MTELPSAQALQAARAIVQAQMPPTPTIRWPLLERRLGGPLYVKHENHTPTGAFKVRGGIVYMAGIVIVGVLCALPDKPGTNRYGPPAALPPAPAPYRPPPPPYLPPPPGR